MTIEVARIVTLATSYGNSLYEIRLKMDLLLMKWLRKIGTSQINFYGVFIYWWIKYMGGVIKGCIGVKYEDIKVYGMDVWVGYRILNFEF